MKKEYEAPKAEKLEFDYSDAVTASGTQCSGGIYQMYTHGYTNCHEQSTQVWVGAYGNQ